MAGGESETKTDTIGYLLETELEATRGAQAALALRAEQLQRLRNALLDKLDAELPQNILDGLREADEKAKQQLTPWLDHLNRSPAHQSSSDSGKSKQIDRATVRSAADFLVRRSTTSNLDVVGIALAQFVPRGSASRRQQPNSGGPIAQVVIVAMRNGNVCAVSIHGRLLTCRNVLQDLSVFVAKEAEKYWDEQETTFDGMFSAASVPGIARNESMDASTPAGDEGPEHEGQEGVQEAPELQHLSVSTGEYPFVVAADSWGVVRVYDLQAWVNGRRISGKRARRRKQSSSSSSSSYYEEKKEYEEEKEKGRAGSTASTERNERGSNDESDASSESTSGDGATYLVELDGSAEPLDGGGTGSAERTQDQQQQPVTDKSLSGAGSAYASADQEDVGLQMRTRRPDDVEVAFYIRAIVQYHLAVEEWDLQEARIGSRSADKDLFVDPDAAEDAADGAYDSALGAEALDDSHPRQDITVVYSVAFRHSKLILLGDSSGSVTALSNTGRIRARIHRPDALLEDASAAEDGKPHAKPSKQGARTSGSGATTSVSSDQVAPTAGAGDNGFIEGAVTAMARTSAAVAVAHGPTIRVLSVSRRAYNNPTCDVPGDGQVVTLAWDVLSSHVVYAGTREGQVFAFNTRHRDGRSSSRVGARCVLKHSVPALPGRSIPAVVTVPGFLIVARGVGSYRVFNTSAVLAMPPRLIAQNGEVVGASGTDGGATGLAPTVAVVTETSRGQGTGEVMIAVLDATTGSIEVVQSLLPYSPPEPWDISWVRTPVIVVGIGLVVLWQTLKGRNGGDVQKAVEGMLGKLGFGGAGGLAGKGRASAISELLSGSRGGKGRRGGPPGDELSPADQRELAQLMRKMSANGSMGGGRGGGSYGGGMGGFAGGNTGDPSFERLARGAPRGASDDFLDDFGGGMD